MKVIFISNKTFVQHSRFETCHIFLFPFIFHLEKNLYIDNIEQSFQKI